jgi:hypothetical protein
VRHVIATDRAHLIGGYRSHSNRIAVERAELDVKGFYVPMDMNDSSDVSGTQTLVRKITPKNDAVVFVDRFVLHGQPRG